MTTAAPGLMLQTPWSFRLGGCKSLTHSPSIHFLRAVRRADRFHGRLFAILEADAGRLGTSFTQPHSLQLSTSAPCMRMLGPSTRNSLL